MTSSNLNIQADIPTPIVEKKLTDVVSQNLENTEMEISGVEIGIKMNGSITLRAEQNILTYQLPLDIHVLRPSGLFTIEGLGKVNMTFQSELSFDKALNLHTQTELINHNWIEKPQLKLGSLSMSVETLIDMIINHTESILIGKIDQAVKESLSIKDVIEKQFENFVKDNEYIAEFGLGADVILENLDFNSIKIDENKLHLTSQLSGYANLGNHTSNLTLPQITFHSDKEKEYIPEFNSSVSLTYPQIIHLANSGKPDLEVGGKKLEFAIKNIYFEDKLYIQIVVESPAKMNVEVSGRPVFKNNSFIELVDLEIIIKPKSMIYRLFVPVIRGMLESRLEEYFPMDVNALLLELPPAPIKSFDGFNFDLSWDSIYIRDLQFDQDGVWLDLTAKKLSMKITGEVVV